MIDDDETTIMFFDMTGLGGFLEDKLDWPVIFVTTCGDPYTIEPSEHFAIEDGQDIISYAKSYRTTTDGRFDDSIWVTYNKHDRTLSVQC